MRECKLSIGFLFTELFSTSYQFQPTVEHHLALQFVDVDVVQKQTDIDVGLVLLVHHWMPVLVVIGEELEAQSIPVPCLR